MYEDGRERVFYFYNSNDGEVLTPFGTVVWRSIRPALEGARVTQVEFASAFCNPRDQFAKRKGRDVCSRRLNVSRQRRLTSKRYGLIEVAPGLNPGEVAKLIEQTVANEMWPASRS